MTVAHSLPALDIPVREALIAGIVVNDHHGCMRDGQAWVATKDVYVLIRPASDQPVAVEAWPSFELAQARFSAVCQEMFPGRFSGRKGGI
jgi:hypothetical protein